MKALSILIPTLPERQNSYLKIFNMIINSCPPELFHSIEILSDDRGREVKTGTKRNDLMKRARGTYIWFIDDDDMIEPYAMMEVLRGIVSDADVICFNGYMTTNGVKRVDWEIRLGHPYKSIQKDGKEYYLRHPNHISPMKRELALKAKFPDKTIFEDYEFAKQLNDKGILKTEYVIDKIIYHYQFISK